MSCCNNYLKNLLESSSYNTASGMSCCNTENVDFDNLVIDGYNTASGMSCCNLSEVSSLGFKFISLQYRKRYELLQQCGSVPFAGKQLRYNTASGMSCCNVAYIEKSDKIAKEVTIPQAV